MPHKQIDFKDMAAPGSEAWQRTVTASKIPAILGISPFQTPGELWMVMSGLAEPEHIEGDYLDFGHDVEDGLVNAWKRHNPGWQTNAGEIAYTDTDLPFPNQATLDRRAKRGRAFRIIECKTSTNFDKWGPQNPDGYTQDDLPGSVLVQVIAQMGISGIHRATVAALVLYDRPADTRMYEVEWDPQLWSEIVECVKVFYDSLSDPEPPMPPQDLIDGLIRQRKILEKSDGVLELASDDLDIRKISRIDSEIQNLQLERSTYAERLLERAGNRDITVDGKAITRRVSGRFSQSRIPSEAKHLLKDPDVLTSKIFLDSRKFEEKYSSLFQSALGDDKVIVKDLNGGGK